jgi:hypothetical protein
MTRPQSTATRLEFYMVWLALRRVTRSEGAIAEPLRHAVTVFLDRIEVLLELELDDDRRQEIADSLAGIRGARLADPALREACARLSDLLGLVLSERSVALRRPKIDQFTYIRLVQLAGQLGEHERGTGAELYAEALAARANISLDRVHAAIARMLADGVVRLPIRDPHGRADAFRVNQPGIADQLVLAFEDREAAARARPDREDGELALPNPREVVVVHGRGTARTAFCFELLRRLGLRPLALDEMVAGSGSQNPSSRELIRSAFARAQAVIVVFTGDDLAGLCHGIPASRPYLHVVFEAGVAVALQHARTIIVEMPPASGLVDLADVHTVGFSAGGSDERHQLVRRLRAAGCDVATDGSTWLNLEFPAASPREPDT